MKECTLQEAVELCKKNGGRFTKKKGETFPWHVRLPNGWIVEEKTRGRLRLKDEYLVATWIYEPPKRSAFEAWNKSKIMNTYVEQENIARYAGRKEGWLGALEELEKYLKCESGPEFQNHLTEKIKEFKEV